MKTTDEIDAALSRLDNTSGVNTGDQTLGSLGAVSEDDPRLADDRVPKDASVTMAKMGTGSHGDIIYYGSGGAASLMGSGPLGSVLATGGVKADPFWSKTAVPSPHNLIGGIHTVSGIKANTVLMGTGDSSYAFGELDHKWLLGNGKYSHEEIDLFIDSPRWTKIEAEIMRISTENQQLEGLVKGLIKIAEEVSSLMSKLPKTGKTK